MIDHTLKMCTSYFVYLLEIFSHIWGMLNVDIFSIQNAKVVPSLCYLYFQQYSFLLIQTLYNDSHIEDVHLLFCAPLINVVSFLRVLNLLIFSIRNA